MPAFMRTTLRITAIGLVVVLITIVVAAVRLERALDPDAAVDEWLNDPSRKLSDSEVVSQQAIVARLKADSTLPFSEIGPEEWNTACVLLPYQTIGRVPCSGSLQCQPALEETLSQNDRWHMDDQLWGIVFYQDCIEQSLVRLEHMTLRLAEKNNGSPIVIRSTQPSYIALSQEAPWSERQIVVTVGLEE
jgi:hypothetical protein